MCSPSILDKIMVPQGSRVSARSNGSSCPTSVLRDAEEMGVGRSTPSARPSSVISSGQGGIPKEHIATGSRARAEWLEPLVRWGQ